MGAGDALDRTPESFVPGYDQRAASDEERLPAVPKAPTGYLRFDTKKLHAALNAKRAVRGLTWQQVAREMGVGPSQLTHLSKGGRTGFPHVVRLARWLGQPVASFTHVTPW